MVGKEESSSKVTKPKACETCAQLKQENDSLLIMFSDSFEKLQRENDELALENEKRVLEVEELEKAKVFSVKFRFLSCCLESSGNGCGRVAQSDQIRKVRRNSFYG